MLKILWKNIENEQFQISSIVKNVYIERQYNYDDKKLIKITVEISYLPYKTRLIIL